MQVFSRIKKQEDPEPKKKEILWQNDTVSIIDYEDWTIIKEKDIVVCIIYLIELNQFIIRQEYIPTYKWRDGQEYYVTVLSGGIETGEDPKRALLREIEEEAGIVIRPEYVVEFMKPLFVSKSITSKYHPAIITLTESDYQEILPKGDGSNAEKLSKSVKVDVKYINSLNSTDLITDYMIDKLKKYLNLV